MEVGLVPLQHRELITLHNPFIPGQGDSIGWAYTGRVEAVNPWELEVDPDFERTEDEIKRDQEAEQRALRAAAIAMRR